MLSTHALQSTTTCSTSCMRGLVYLKTLSLLTCGRIVLASLWSTSARHCNSRVTRQSTLYCSSSSWRYVRMYMYQCPCWNMDYHMHSCVFGWIMARYLEYFLFQEPSLRATQYLPDIIRLQQRLYDCFHRRLDRKDASRFTIGDFLRQRTNGN